MTAEKDETPQCVEIRFVDKKQTAEF